MEACVEAVRTYEPDFRVSNVLLEANGGENEGSYDMKVVIESAN